METQEEDNLLNTWGSHYPPNASTIAAMAAGNPQIQQIYKAFLDEVEKHTKPVSIAVAIDDSFSYNEDTDAIYTTVDALGEHFDTTNARTTTIELLNPATGNQRTFTWHSTQDTGAKSTMHHEYRAMHEGRKYTLCVWFYGVKNLSA